jgi:predicted O-methyltransferase YrrM
MTSHTSTAPPTQDPPQIRRPARRVLVRLVTRSVMKAFSVLPFTGRLWNWLERHQMLRGVILSVFGLQRPIFIDHPMRPAPRFGYGRPEHAEIKALLGRDRSRYAERLNRFLALSDELAAIPLRGRPEDTAPYWDNTWLPPLDAFALYGFLVEVNPRRYVEIGSGNSTKFVRRAIEDHGLRTHITSIDPEPRAHIDALCDVTIRSPLEETDLGIFASLEAGDIIFLDGSHRVFMGSDVTVFFFEVLPLLRPGVLVHIHDILLPRDYPPYWRLRYYSEQYLLAAFLLADPARFDVELPNAFIHGEGDLKAQVEPLWKRIALTEAYTPASFWLRIREIPERA